MIVLDASAVLELLLATPTGLRVGERIAPADESLHAPDLLDIEIASALRRYALAGIIRSIEGSIALVDLSELDVVRYPAEPLLERIWQLRAGLSAAEACYLALAEALEAPLVTADPRLAQAEGHRATIELILTE